MQKIKDCVIGIYLYASGIFSYTKIGTVNVYNNKKYVEPNEKLEGQDLPHLEKSFTGRNEELAKLDLLFFKENKRKVAICGFAGSGKSELAKQFAVNSKQEEKVSDIIWINAGNKTDVQTSFKKLAKILKIKCKEQLVKSVYDCFKKNTIIVFDNVPNRKTVQEYEPKSDNFYCIYTCQNNCWIGEVEPFQINELSPEATLQIFEYYLGNDYNKNDSYKYKRLSEYFGKFPLVLQIVASFIKREINAKGIDFNLDNYIQELLHSHEILEDSIVNTSLCNTSILYSKSIYEAIKKSLDKIKELDKLAFIILLGCSLLNSEHIFYNVLFEMPTISKLLINTKNKMKKLKEALKLLNEYSFIQIKGEQIIIYNFMQNLIRHQLFKHNDQLKNEIFSSCTQLILSNNNYIHIPIITKHADESDDYVNIFFDFYKSIAENVDIKKRIKFKDCTGLQLILESLIEGRCKRSLKKVLHHLVFDKSRKYINEYYLLQEAACVGDLEIFKLLLSYKPVINQKDKHGHDALHVAAFKWNEEIIKILLKNKAKLDTIDYNDNTVLHSFVKGANNIAAQTIDPIKAIKIINLLKGNKIINEIKNRSGESLLHIAVSSFRPELIKLLIDEYDINPDALDLDKCTPLHELVYQATRVGKDDVILQERVIKSAETLLTNNANLNICNNEQKTPLETAISFEIEFLTNVLNNKRNEVEVSTLASRKRIPIIFLILIILIYLPLCEC